MAYILLFDILLDIIRSRRFYIDFTVGCLLLVSVAACDSSGEISEGAGPELPDGTAGVDGLSGPYRMGDVELLGDTVLVQHDDDLWVVSREGGDASRLLPGGARDQEGLPVPFPRYAPAFSPRGGRLAFSAASDAYVLDRSSREIRRLTFHPRGDLVRGWTPAGDTVLFASYRWKSGNNFQLHAVSSEGGTPRRLPPPFAFDGAVSPDGRRLVVQRFGPANMTEWLSYAGGLSRPLRVLDRETWTGVDSVPHRDLQDVRPMWTGRGVYFVSARGRAATPDPSRPGGFDLYRWEPGGGEPERLTRFGFRGVDAAAAGEDDLVLSAEGRLYLYTPGAGTLVPIPVRFPDGELSPVDSTRVPLSASARDVRFGEDDRTLVAEIRGDLYLWRPGSARPQRLTRTAGVREHGAALAPDGSSLAYWSDVSGEERLYVAPLTAEGPVARGGESDADREARDVLEIRVQAAPTRYRNLAWSPDGRRLAFSGEGLGLWVADPEAGEARRIARSTFPGQGAWEHAWSPNGRLLAYAMAAPSGVRSVRLYDTRTDRHHRVSDPLAHAGHPAFDASGRYLWFATSEQRPLASARDIPGWGSLSSTWNLPLMSARLQVAVLDPGEPAPILPSGEPNPGTGVPDGDPERPGEEAEANDGEPPTALDLEGVSGRVLPLPVERRDVVELEAFGPGRVLVRAVEWPHTPVESGGLPTPVLLLGLDAPGELRPVLDDADELRVGPERGAFLHRHGQAWRLSRIAGATSGGDATPAAQLSNVPLDWGDDSLAVERRPEWRQILREVRDRVRTTYVGPERDTLNLDALVEHYAAFLPNLRSRNELNALIRHMLGHLDLVSHLGVGGGDDWPRRGERPVTDPPATAGLLGADLVADGSRYRFDRVYRANRYTALYRQVTAPLDQPGIGVREGEYLIAVNGEPVTTDRNLHAHLVGTAGRSTRITVGPDPDGTDARELDVFPVSDDRMLRESTWAEENRRRVERATDGRAGYVWLKAFSEVLLRNATGALAALQDREALVVDVRFNGGGTTADELVEILGRSHLYGYDFRHGDDLRVPALKSPQQRVLIANQHDASAAETFSLMWKRAELGPVVGTHTMGGLVGSALNQPPLVDGGQVLMPNRASRAPGLPTSSLEGVGIEPDVFVDWTVEDGRTGPDPQLEAAIRSVLNRLP